MSKQAKNKFHFRPNYGIFVGTLNDNIVHQHYAVQLSICLNEVMKLTVDEVMDIKSSFYLNSNIPHQLICPETQLTILINPISKIGYYLQHLHKSEMALQINEKVFSALSLLLRDYQIAGKNFETLCSKIDLFFKGLEELFEEELGAKDNRIIKAITYLDDNFAKQVSLEEVAKICFLSPSRLLHLFKEETQTTFRRYKLWNKLVKSLPSLKLQSITSTAHQFGFTDSSHYTRTFKETFGITPKFILPKD